MFFQVSFETILTGSYRVDICAQKPVWIQSALEFVNQNLSGFMHFKVVSNKLLFTKWSLSQRYQVLSSLFDVESLISVVDKWI